MDTATAPAPVEELDAATLACLYPPEDPLADPYGLQIHARAMADGMTERQALAEARTALASRARWVSATFRRCWVCVRWRRSVDFDPAPTRADGLHQRCRACRGADLGYVAPARP